MVLGPRLLERKTLTCFALAMMVTAMLHGDDDADDPMDWDDDGDGLGLEMIIVPILLILLRLAEKDTFAWVKRRNRTIDSFSDEEAKAFSALCWREGSSNETAGEGTPGELAPLSTTTSGSRGV